MPQAMLLYAHLTDNELVLKVKAGHTDCFEVLTRRHIRMLYRIARMHGLGKAEAEEMVGEVCREAFTRLPSLEIGTSYRNWIAGLMTQVCRQQVTDLDAAAPAEEQEHEDEGDTGVVTEPQATLSRPSALQKSLEALPFILRGPVVLCEIEGFSAAEAAALLRIDQSLLASRLEEVKKKLSGRLLKSIYYTDVFKCKHDCRERVVEAVMTHLVAQ